MEKTREIQDYGAHYFRAMVLFLFVHFPFFRPTILYSIFFLKEKITKGKKHDYIEIAFGISRSFILIVDPKSRVTFLSSFLLSYFLFFWRHLWSLENQENLGFIKS